jgi:hypothetical protein
LQIYQKDETKQKKHPRLETYILLPFIKIESGTFPLSKLPVKKITEATSNV